MVLTVNGEAIPLAPVTIVVAPFHPIPNLPPGYVEETRWTNVEPLEGTTTVIRCWPSDLTTTRIPRGR